MRRERLGSRNTSTHSRRNFSPNNNRARDLVDLQLIANNSEIDYAKTEATCRRLFAYRKKQAWPPMIIKGDGWDDLYKAAKEDLAVLATADEAVEWTNELIKQILAQKDENP